MAQQLIATFLTVFLAELGDKTQIATFPFAANPNTNRWLVLVGVCSALFLISFLTVLIGAKAGNLVNPEHHLKVASGLLFIGIGLSTLWK